MMRWDDLGDLCRVYVGDCREAMTLMPAQSVHCVVTSPPYWSQRDYGLGPVAWADGDRCPYGLERSVEGYIRHTVEIFRAIGRVLRPDGVIWWNIGDGMNDRGGRLFTPARVAMALQEAGWCVRQEIIWRKPSPMPESLDGVRWERRDGGLVLRRGRWRPTLAHEYVLMVTRGRYFCVATQVAEPATGRPPGNLQLGNGTAYNRNDSFSRRTAGCLGALAMAVETRNPRSVWTIAPEPTRELHFAPFPSELPYRCIRAATSDAGCCPACGAQYAPVVQRERVPTRPGRVTKAVGDPLTIGNRDPCRHIVRKVVSEYLPTCDCRAGDPTPCVVLDPFAGTGATLQAAVWCGRRAIGCEMQAEYLPIIERRIQRKPRCIAGNPNGS